MADEAINTTQPEVPSMGESLDGIIASATQVTSPEPATPEVPQETSPEETGTPETTETPETLPEDQSKQNQAFASMRKQNSDYQKKIELAEAFIKKNGFESIDDMMNKQADEQLKTEAEEAKVSPEVYNRLKQLEASELARQQEYETKKFASKVVEMQNDLGLEREQLTAFGKIADELGIDLRTTKVPLRQLYLGLNYDSLVTNKVEAEKQEWLAGQDRAQNQAPTTTQRKGGSEPRRESVQDIMKKITERFT